MITTRNLFIFSALYEWSENTKSYHCIPTRMTKIKQAMLERMLKNCNIYILPFFFSSSAMLENTLAVTQNVECRVSLWPSNSTPRFITKRMENIYPCKNTHS